MILRDEIFLWSLLTHFYKMLIFTLKMIHFYTENLHSIEVEVKVFLIISGDWILKICKGEMMIEKNFSQKAKYE